MSNIFLLDRSNILKYFVSIIAYLKNRNKKIEILIINSELNFGEKSQLKPIGIQCKLISKIQKKHFKNYNQVFSYLIKNKKIKNIFSLSFLEKKFVFSLKNSLSISQKDIDTILKKWCVIFHGMDSFSDIKSKGVFIDKNIKFFLPSKYIYNYGIRYLKKFSTEDKIRSLKKIRTYFIGNSLYQKKNFLEHTKKKYLLYMPFPYYQKRYPKKNNFAFQAAYVGNNINFYSYYRNNLNYSFLLSVLKGSISFVKNILEIVKNYNNIKKYYHYQNEENIIKSMRIFCDNNNLKFICKPRLKFPYNKLINKYADKVIYDDEKKIYPTKLQEILSKTKIVVGSLSSVVFETSLANVPYINIETPNIAFLEKENKFLHNYSHGLWYNYKSVVVNYSIINFIKYFSNKKIAQFMIKSKDRKEYIRKFNGIICEKNNYVGKNINKFLN